MQFRIGILAVSSLLCILIYATSRHVERALFIADVRHRQQPLPEGLIELKSKRGMQLLKRSHHKTDLKPLERFYTSQIYLSYCGVATGVMLSNALLNRTVYTQSNWFTGLPGGVHSAYETFFGGMTLGQFDDLMTARGFRTTRFHGGELSLDEFRERIIRNMSNEENMLVINYHRPVLNQKGGGHFSPIAAYEQQDDRVLILDVAEHKYPPVWAPLNQVWKALDTTDRSAHAQRGMIEVAHKQ